MIPNMFLKIDNLPLLPNGKINRKALLSPFKTEEIKEEASDSNADWIKELWEKMLSVPVAKDGDFFDLGGHSMLGIQMTAAVNKKIGSNIGLKDLFLNSSLEKFSSLCLKASNSSEKAEQKIPRSKLENPDLNATQRRMWYLEQLDEGTTIHNLPGAWALDRRTDVEKLKKAFSLVIKNNEAMRMYVDDSSGIPKQMYAPKNHGLEIRDLHFNSRSEAIDYMDTISKTPIDINSFPLFHLQLLHVKGDKIIMYFNKHHMIWDGWSVDLFLGKLNKYYFDLNSDHDSKLTSYKDYSVWSDNNKKTESYKKELDYWKSVFNSEPPLLDIPSSMPRPDEMTNKAIVTDKVFTSDQMRKIDSFVKDLGITDFMFFIGCYYKYLAKLSKQKDIVIGTPIRGRELTELEDVIGVFINVMPLRFKDLLNLGTIEYFRKLKKYVLKVLLEAAHQSKI